MKTYPKTSRTVTYSEYLYIFDKLDGSNIRVEWTSKTGFSKFGSRKRLLGSDQGVLQHASELILNKYQKDLEKIIRKQKWQKATFFFEFFGENSFAGFHDPDDNFDVVLIDVAVYKKGILSPQDFIKIFKNVDTPRLLYQGRLNKPLEEEIRTQTLEGITFEGVVCKYTRNKVFNSFKIKTYDWLDKLKTKCDTEDLNFDHLK